MTLKLDYFYRCSQRGYSKREILEAYLNYAPYLAEYVSQRESGNTAC